MLNSDNRAAGLIVAVIVGALVAGAFALTSLSARGDSLGDAAALRSADLAIVAQDLAMTSIGQAVLVAEDEALGVATSEDVEVAAERATADIAGLEERVSNLEGSASSVLTSLSEDWQTIATSVVARTTVGDPAAAAGDLIDKLVPAAAALNEELTRQRDAWATAVADAEGSVGLLTRVAGFMLLFLLPFAAVLIYRISVHRQIREMTEVLDTRLAAETDAGSDQAERWTGAAQELQAPLQALVAEARELAARPGLRDAEEASQISKISNQAADLSGRVDDLLVAVGGERSDAIETETVEIADLLDDAIAELTERGHRIGGTYGRGRVFADRDRVEQILRNLVTNASKYGGSRVSIYGDIAGSSYVVAVEDNGDGLPEDVADAFMSGAAKDGVGLGLTVSRKLAKTLGGSLDYERVTGRTSFILSLPVSDQQIDAPRSDVLLAAANH